MGYLTDMAKNKLRMLKIAIVTLMGILSTPINETLDTIQKENNTRIIKYKQKKFGINNDNAIMEAKQIVFLVIGIYIMASLLPSAITALNGVNQTGWTTAQIALWGIVSIIIIAVILVKIAE